MTATETPVAIVGVGKIARDQHVPSIAGSDAFRLAATASRSGGIEGVENHPTLEALLEARPDIPAVALCMPPQVRYDAARAALLADRHVLLEKPPGATLSEVEALRDLAETRGLTLFATWHSRFARGVPAAKARLAGRRVRRFEIVWREDVRHWHPGQAWIWEAGGLGVFDPGINALSILTEILPAPVHITGAELEFPENRDTPIAARLTFAGPDGLTGAADFDWRQTGPQTWDIAVETDDGRVELSSGGAQVRADGAELSDGDALASEYDGIYARFAELLAAGRGEVDVAPLRHVADAFTLGRRIAAAPFHD